MIKVVKKEGIDKPRLVHNKKLFWTIIILGIVLIIVIILLVMSYHKAPVNNQNNSASECNMDSDCVKGSCCHASSCVPAGKKPDCSRIFCTDECSGPLDCGAGRCGCVNNKCTIIPNR